MVPEDTFNVKLGRIMSPTGTRRFVSFAGRVKRAAQKSSRGRPRSSFKSSTVKAEFFSRRVIVKFSLAKMEGFGLQAMQKHLAYVERDSAAKDTEKGTLYNGEELSVDKEEFHETCKDDRHYFKVIVSAEDGKELHSLRNYTRSLMAQMERDLGTELEWVAADHYDTGRPHTHIIIRGVKDDGKNLVIGRDYISKGLRERAEELATLELGPVSQIDVAEKLARQVKQERFTALDKDLLFDAKNNVVSLVEIKQDGSDWSQRLKIWRVKHLAQMGLAEKINGGRWRLDAELEPTLRRMGDRGDILKAYHQTLRTSGVDRRPLREPIYDPRDSSSRPFTGAVIKAGVLDDVNDRTYLVVDTLEGHAVFVETGGAENIDRIKTGMVVTIETKTFAPRKSDITIAQIAKDRLGIYSPSAHEHSDPKAREEYIQAHVRRLEAMRRAGHVTRQKDGSWKVPKNYLKLATDFEKSKSFINPVDITLRSRLSLEQMTGAVGRTFLDEELLANKSENQAAGFGEDVEEAKQKRIAFLRSQNVISSGNEVSEGTLKSLETMDLEGAAKAVGRGLEKPYKPKPEDGRITGIYRQAIDRPSGRYAVIEKSKEFTLVPWRKTMDRNLGKSISGLIRGQSISWTLTKGMGRNIS